MKIRTTIIVLIAIVAFFLGFAMCRFIIAADESQAYDDGWNDCKEHYNIRVG